jgi:HupE / UreJ protein
VVSLEADSFGVDVSCDLDALALGVDASADSAALAAEIGAMAAPAQDELATKLTDFLTRRLRLRFDGAPAPFTVSFPERGQARPAGSPPSFFGLVARLSGRTPTGAKEATFFASRAFPLVRLVWRSGTGGRPAEEVLVPGAESHPYPMAGAPIDEPAGETAWRFLTLGFTHILPKGLDHILFVVGLALLSPRPRPLLAQITAFTLAHTLTLGLSTYGVFRLSSRVVEPLIALSIVYVAVENLLTTKLRPSRLVLVFAFGLLHGLGFAGVLGELGWPQGRRLLALLAFNGGVEAGQVTVVALALLLVAGWARAGGDRRRLVQGASITIAAVGAFWAVSRVVAP